MKVSRFLEHGRIRRGRIPNSFCLNQPNPNSKPQSLRTCITSTCHLLLYYPQSSTQPAPATGKGHGKKPKLPPIATTRGGSTASFCARKASGQSQNASNPKPSASATRSDSLSTTLSRISRPDVTVLMVNLNQTL